jgi:hypothetical protein
MMDVGEFLHAHAFPLMALAYIAFRAIFVLSKRNLFWPKFAMLSNSASQP